MSARDIVMSAGGNSNDTKLYVDDVFSTYLYTGNGSTQTINNGIDLAGEGGLVWLKCRSGVNTNHALFDTARGVQKRLQSNTAGSEATNASYLTAFNSNGFSVGSDGDINSSVSGYTALVSWTFRKAPKFFDVVTYTGDGVAGRQIPHSLGVAPGMIIVKRTDATGDWLVYNIQNGASKYMYLNLTNAPITSASAWNTTAPDSGVFTVGANIGTNGNGATYVAYLFAHDPSADGIIQCGSTPTIGYVDLGWEPQYVLYKRADAISDWAIADVNRGFGAGHYKLLRANKGDPEVEIGDGGVGSWITPTGFYCSGFGAGAYIYLAIRRPNKPPTSGTAVFALGTRTDNTTTNEVITAGFVPDLIVQGRRTGAPSDETFAFNDRLRGGDRTLVANKVNAESSGSKRAKFDVPNGTYEANWCANTSYPSTLVHYAFRRAPGFFDVVTYTGDGVFGRQIPHGLGVVPGLVIVKARSTTSDWYVKYKDWSNNGRLNLTNDFDTTNGNINTVDATTFTVHGGYNCNVSGVTYVAYLFASLPGISKVGSYTGNGSSQTIDCGFTTGARFILIKRGGTGDWYVWDSARGIIAANDPHLSLNTAAAEVTTDDSVDPASSGFIVNQDAATNINVTSATYIYLAIA